MKKFHNNKGKAYDWVKRTNDLFVELYEKAKQSKLFSDEELVQLNEAYLLQANKPIFVKIITIIIIKKTYLINLI